MRMTQLEIPANREVIVAQPQANNKIVSQKEFVETQAKRNEEAFRMRRAAGSSGSQPTTSQTIRIVIASLEKK